MESNKHPKLFLADVVAKSPDLARFVKQIQQLSQLNQALKQHLDPELAPHCQVANLRNGILILTTHSSIWGHQLRFQEMALLSALRNTPDWCGLKSIQFRVVPASPIPSFLKPDLEAHHQPPRLCLSIHNAKHLQETAHNMQSPRLKQALLRLATHANTGYK